MRLDDGRLIVNPGSVGLQAYDDDHPCPHIVENGSPHARYALLERRAEGWQVELRALPYDHEAAARRAEANGRGDWADALRSGLVGRMAKRKLPVRPAQPRGRRYYNRYNFVEHAMHSLKIKQIGNSLGLILPREVLARLKLEKARHGARHRRAERARWSRRMTRRCRRSLELGREFMRE